MDDFIVHDAELTEQRLISHVDVPKSIQKYFKSSSLFIEYDTDITPNNSILNIPLVATVLPLAWLTGSDIYVEELDRTFKESMDELKQWFMKTYPNAPFTTEIKADVLVENQIKANPSDRTGLLFSGGVDSSYSLITNLDLKPRLILFWGTDTYPYPENGAQWNKIIDTYSEFAERLGLKLNIVKTNISVLLDDRRISHDFHDVIYDGRFRFRMLHSFVLIPLVAPLSMGRFDHLIFSGGGPRDPNDTSIPEATLPEIDEKMIWADYKVSHWAPVHREEKIKALTEYFKNDKVTLKVCINKLDQGKLNDSTCEKCLKTIANLALNGVDPNEYGFKVDDSTFQTLKTFIETGISRSMFFTMNGWVQWQKSIPDQIPYDLYGSEAFFEWFKTVDLKTKEKNVWLYRDIYMKLPYSIAKPLDMVYNKMGIKIHDKNPPRHP